MIVESLISVFSFIYLFMIIDVIFSSSKSMLNKQFALEGKFLFFIYSLFVYTKSFKLNIFLFDTFVNEPIIQAYTMMDSFLTNFFSISIQGNPWVIIMYLIPAGFVYNFVKYWFSFGFGDKKIAEMISLVALVLFISNGGQLGLINLGGQGGVPFAGLFSTLGLSYFLEIFPSLELNYPFIMNLPEWAKLSVSLVTILTVFFSLNFIFSLIMNGVIKWSTRKDEGPEVKKAGKIAGIVIGLLFGIFSIITLVNFSKTGFFEVVTTAGFLKAFIYLPILFVAGISGVIVISELLIYVAFHMVVKDVNKGMGRK